MIIDDEGTIFANSGLSSFKMNSSIDSVQYKSLQKEDPVEGEYVDKDQRYLEIGKPIFENHQFIGAIFVLSSLGEMDASINQLQKFLFFAGIGALLMAAGIIYIVSKQVTSPLLEMEKATRKIAKGDLVTKLTYKTKEKLAHFHIPLMRWRLKLQGIQNGSFSLIFLMN